MHINKRTHKNQRAENKPTPEGACAEAVINISALQFIADSGRNIIVPYKGSNA